MPAKRINQTEKRFLLLTQDDHENRGWSGWEGAYSTIEDAVRKVYQMIKEDGRLDPYVAIFDLESEQVVWNANESGDSIIEDFRIIQARMKTMPDGANDPTVISSEELIMLQEIQSVVKSGDNIKRRKMIVDVNPEHIRTD